MGQIAQIIKYEGDNSTFVWKHPNEDFNSLTELIVHESQEAVFFMNAEHTKTRQTAEQGNRRSDAVPLRSIFYQ